MRHNPPHKLHTINTGKGGKGQPGDGKHKTGVPSGTGQHPKFGKGPKQNAAVNLNRGMDPGTQVPHATARSSSQDILDTTQPKSTAPAFLKSRGAKRRFGSAASALRVARSKP